MDALIVLSLVEIGPVVLKKIFKFLLFRNYRRFEKGVTLYLKNLNPRHMVALCQVWLKLAQLWKDYRQTDRRTTDYRRSEKLTCGGGGGGEGGKNKINLGKIEPPHNIKF